jgi:hypothetical protein
MNHCSPYHSLLAKVPAALAPATRVRQCYDANLIALAKWFAQVGFIKTYATIVVGSTGTMEIGQYADRHSL